MLTTLLIVIVLALAIANIYIFSKRSEEFEEIDEGFFTKSNVPIEYKLNKLNSKIDFALKRIDKLEKAITKNGYVLVSKEELKNRLEKLEDFKREATIVMEALKERLVKNSKKKKAKKTSLDQDLEERIREIVFHAANRKR